MVAAPNIRVPATIKSLVVQFTSLVNCMAINGKSNSNRVDRKKRIIFLNCMVLHFFDIVVLSCLLKDSENVLYFFETYAVRGSCF